MTESAPRAGILGTHVEMSLSPIIHNAAYQEMGLDLEYVLFQVPEIKDDVERQEFLKAYLAEQAASGVVGMSVTMPFKTDLLKCDRVSQGSEQTRNVGSINTLSMPDEGIWFPDSTDWQGAMLALTEADVEVSGKTALVLGGGGTAPAVSFGLAEYNAETVIIANRTKSKADKIATNLERLYPDIQFLTTRLENGVLPEWAIRDADIIFNTTNVGQQGKPEEGNSPLGHEMIRKIMAGAAICDAVYMPINTPLLEMAAGRGDLTVINGTRMLLYQAVPQVAAFTGQYDVPIEAMDAALQKEIAQRLAA
jgi:shikimate dehydrogenase